MLRHVIWVLLWCGFCCAQKFEPQIPRAWDGKEVATFETPLAQRDRSPRYMTAAEYYKLSVRPIYKSYPAYAEGREPARYRDELMQREPEEIFDPTKLYTKEDWIRAGKLVFEAPAFYQPAPEKFVYPKQWNVPVNKDGQIPGFVGSFVIRKKGVIERGLLSCAECHTRIMPDGSLVEGAQGMFLLGGSAEGLTAERFRAVQDRYWRQTGAPWVQSRDDFLSFFTIDFYGRLLQGSRSGVFPRAGSSLTSPVHIPSLIGVEERKYFDATGLVRHRSIGDLMRYAITNQALNMTAFYGDFQPSTRTQGFGLEDGTRYGDEQLYALALYVYSLKPPNNPNPSNDSARRGERLFGQQGCAGCHTPPLYTNNKLTPATGFDPPADLRQSGDVMNVSVGTDPELALKTRRGTGFYKVPSLRGVWFRGMFGHSGWAATLEEWFDPARLKDGYVPQGFHIGSGPIRGHEFGLRLSESDRADLIAFLRTL